MPGSPQQGVKASGRRPGMELHGGARGRSGWGIVPAEAPLLRSLQNIIELARAKDLSSKANGALANIRPLLPLILEKRDGHALGFRNHNQWRSADLARSLSARRSSHTGESKGWPAAATATLRTDSRPHSRDASFSSTNSRCCQRTPRRPDLTRGGQPRT